MDPKVEYPDIILLNMTDTRQLRNNLRTIASLAVVLRDLYMHITKRGVYDVFTHETYTHEVIDDA